MSTRTTSAPVVRGTSFLGRRFLSSLVPLVVLGLPSNAEAQGVGSFDGSFNHSANSELKFNAIHAATLATPLLTPAQTVSEAQVLVWGLEAGQSNFSTITTWAIVQPEKATVSARFPNGIQQFTDSRGNLFCGGQGWLSTGNLVAFGGTAAVQGNPVGTDMVYEFERPSATFQWGRWIQRPDLAVKRWYAGVCRMSTLNLGAFGGVIGNEVSANTYESYDEVLTAFDTHPTTSGQCSSPGAHSNRILQEYCGPGLSPLNEAAHLGQYAALHQLAGHDKEIFVAGPNPEVANQGIGVVGKYHPSRVQHDPTIAIPSWDVMLSSAVPPAPTNRPREYGCSVRMPVPAIADEYDKVMNLGGEDWLAGTILDSTEVCFSARASSPGWDYAAGPTMHKERKFANAVVLPTAEVLVLGGQGNPVGIPPQSPQHFAPELLRGSTWVLGTGATSASRRSYHSTAVLLPSGRLLLGGDDFRNFDYDLYSPWYMSGYYRPIIQSYPSALGYGSTGNEVTYSLLPATYSVTKVVLTRPTACTHHVDMGQRYVECVVTASTRTKVTFKAPLSAKFAPRGFYMLWLISDENVPSTAVWVDVRP